jgi:hypothetical protein
MFAQKSKYTEGAKWILDTLSTDLEPVFIEKHLNHKVKCNLRVFHYLLNNQVDLDKNFIPNLNLEQSLSLCLEQVAIWHFSPRTSCLFVSTFQAYAAELSPIELNSLGIPGMAKVCFRRILRTCEPEVYGLFQ